jgi:hypothetical protein
MHGILGACVLHKRISCRRRGKRIQACQPVYHTPNKAMSFNYICYIKNELVSSEKQRGYVNFGLSLDMVGCRKDVHKNDRKYTTNQDDRETGGSAGVVCGIDIAI